MLVTIVTITSSFFGNSQDTSEAYGHLGTSRICYSEQEVTNSILEFVGSCLLSAPTVVPGTQ